MAADFDQIETDLATAAAKIFASGIRSYSINGRTMTFNSPEEILRALEKAQAAKATAAAMPATTYAEVQD